MATILNVGESIAQSPPTALPAWTNALIGHLNTGTVIHSGGGELDGAWHSQDSDELLVVIEGACTVDTIDGPTTLRSGDVALISAGEAHRVSTQAGTRLVAVEAASARRTPLSDPTFV
ncbi:cupin domain-containing protein [Ruicaihuangia caeni]|uniref:Cupin domain-containing protein n=1 Tax=Ruicaihuangia caeni TaxID=3042517 RepID=A0AAW6T9F3_9MICO|nr:cupin domain-containing protein [Klugiella sp. YN-L-19]MDI2098663.1 cupin domain-containing protein [Klugiella sp. YN-L-19]